MYEINRTWSWYRFPIYSNVRVKKKSLFSFILLPKFNYYEFHIKVVYIFTNTFKFVLNPSWYNNYTSRFTLKWNYTSVQDLCTNIECSISYDKQNWNQWKYSAAGEWLYGDRYIQCKNIQQQKWTNYLCVLRHGWFLKLW